MYEQSNMILSMLIPGPQGPCDVIDIYLQPLIKKLNVLWETGVETLMQQRRNTYNYVQLFYGLLMIFMPTECRLDGVLRENGHAHVVLRIHAQNG